MIGEIWRQNSKSLCLRELSMAETFLGIDETKINFNNYYFYKTKELFDLSFIPYKLFILVRSLILVIPHTPCRIFKKTLLFFVGFLKKIQNSFLTLLIHKHGQKGGTWIFRQ